MHSYLKGHPSLIQAIKRLEQLNPDQFEIYFEYRSSTKIDVKNQQIDSLARAEDVGLAIRLIKDQRPGFSFTTSLAPDAILQAVNTAFEVATFMPEDPLHGFLPFGNFVYPSVDHFDIQGQKISLEQKMDLARTLEAQCKEVDARITLVRQASLSETVIKTHLVDSNGESIEHEATGYSASITCKAESQGESQTGSDFSFSNYLDTLAIQSTAHQAAHYALENLGAQAAPTMKCPAVLRNSVVADLIDFLSDSFSAESIDKGMSMLTGKQGQFLFSEQVNLINDGLLPGGMGTAPFDAEGIPSKKVALVENGFLSQFLYDSYYAKKFDTEPTGCSVRGIKAPPSIGFSNLYLEPGRKSVETLYDGISRGVLITDLMGVHTANPVTGDFSLGATGILIENGRLTRAVRGFAVAGNVLDLFRRVTDVGGDLKFFGKVGAPSVRLSELMIGGT